MAVSTTDEYINQFDKAVQENLQKIRQFVHEIIPEAQEAMTYGVPAFKLNGKTIINYAAFKSHIGIYPGPKVIEMLREDLKDYETSKGTIKFPFVKPLPLSLVKKIIKSI